MYLPASFQWSRRPVTLTDGYELTFRDRKNATIVGQTEALGYVDGVTIRGLSSKMSTGVSYAWEVWALNPDGGYGISYGTRVVTFNPRPRLARGADTQLSANFDTTDARMFELPPRAKP